MKQRQLALQLAALPALSRRQLLDELPPAKREQLEQLLGEVAPLIGDRQSLFERIMAETDLVADAPAYDEVQLNALLGNESVALKRQLADVFARNQKSLISAHVQGIIAAHLRDKAALLPPEALPPTRSAWRRWWSR